MTNNLSSVQLRRAANIKDKIEVLQRQLSSILGSSNPAADGKVVKPRRQMSAAAKEKIAAAQRARWARFHAAKKKAAK